MSINSSTIQKMHNQAMISRSKAYCPYSNFRVGSTILGGNGKYYTGCNVENAVGTFCAERTAIVKMVEDGCREIIGVYVVTELSGEQVAAPCGFCRQYIKQFSLDDVLVVVCRQNCKFIWEVLKKDHKNHVLLLICYPCHLGHRVWENLLPRIGNDSIIQTLFRIFGNYYFGDFVKRGDHDPSWIFRQMSDGGCWLERVFFGVGDFLDCQVLQYFSECPQFRRLAQKQSPICTPSPTWTNPNSSNSQNPRTSYSGAHFSKPQPNWRPHTQRQKSWNNQDTSQWKSVVKNKCCSPNKAEKYCKFSVPVRLHGLAIHKIVQYCCVNIKLSFCCGSIVFRG